MNLVKIQSVKKFIEDNGITQETKYCREICKKARIELGYSKTTSALDIWCTIKRYI